MIVCVCFCVSTTDTTLVSVNVGHCEDNNLILNETFVWYYQKAYVSMYVICLLVVIVLYVAIFGGRHLYLFLCWSSSSSTSLSLVVVIYHSFSIGRHRPLRRHLWWSSSISLSLLVVIVHYVAIFGGRHLYLFLYWSSSSSTSPSLVVFIYHSFSVGRHRPLRRHLWWSSSITPSLLVVIVLYVAVFAAVLRQRRKRQKRRRNQLAAAANTATTKSLTATQSHGVRRPLSSDSTEMATIIHSKADDAGVVDGAEVMVVSNEERQQPAAVQTSKFNLRCKAADQKGTKMKMISRKYCCWHKITTKSRIFNRCSNVEVQ